MPPKKAPGPSKKNVEKKKEKLVEDKTFGLKNKNKSKNVQKYIQEVTKQVKGGNTRADRLKEQQLSLKKAKAEIDPLKALFAASITQPKLAPGVDPKSVLCAFHKAGVCTKGNRCKYSHDLNVEKKSAKINLYSDARDDEKAKDKMDTWDQSKLESVVAEKHGDKAAKQTDIVCKHFLDAIERSLYGWFWVCPNGGTACKYRHALPPGYVFKTRAEREAEKSKKVEEISIEEIIEQQRAKLGPSGGTPVTAETLAKWKADKIARKKVEEEKRRKEELKKTGGRGIMSGRALFTFDPTLFRDDADADEDKYSQHDPNEERDDSDSDGEDNDDDNDDDDEEEKPAASSVDAAAAVMDKSLYLQDAEDLDSLKDKPAPYFFLSAIQILHLFLNRERFLFQRANSRQKLQFYYQENEDRNAVLPPRTPFAASGNTKQSATSTPGKGKLAKPALNVTRTSLEGRTSAASVKVTLEGLLPSSQLKSTLKNADMTRKEPPAEQESATTASASTMTSSDEPRAEMGKVYEISGTATAIALLGICIISVSIRLFSVVRWGSVIHEFDPHFNFRVSKFLAQNGVMELLNWFDDRAWYPLGRIVGTTVYPGLMEVAALIYWFMEFISIPVEIRHVCVFIAPLFAAFSSLALFLLTKEVTGKTTTALLAAMLLGVSPAYMSRSAAGSFDNEAVAIFLLVITFYLWVKTVHTGSMLWAAITALAFFGMVVSWGGYVFIINVIPIHVLALVLSGHYSSRVYIAYSTFYPLAILLSMQVPFVGFNAVLKGENAASHGMFALLQAVAMMKWLQTQLSVDQFAKLFKVCLAVAAVLVGTVLVAALALGKLQWSGRSLTLLIPTYASKYIPIVASVGEHQPTSWSGFYLALGPAMLFSPLGMYYSFQRLSAGFTFMIVYSVFAVYFSGVMVRLLLTLAPASCFLSAVGISTFLDRVASMTRANATYDPMPSADANAMKDVAAQKDRQSDEYSGDTLKALSVKLRFVSPPKGMQTGLRPSEVPSAIGLLLIAVCLLLVVHVRQSATISRKAYSSTSLVYENWNITTREKTAHDDYREAYMWLRQNTPEDAKILGWWDYGYQISSLANRTVIVDNNTWNNTHIATVGRVLTSTEEEALPILQSLGVDYIFILFGGKVGMSGDDLDKLPWIIKITEGVFPETTIESEFQVNGKYVFHENSTSAVTSSLLYKFSFVDFAQLDNGDGTDATQGLDRNRRTKVASEISLKHFEEAFTSEQWIVRIYKVKHSR